MTGSPEDTLRLTAKNLGADLPVLGEAMVEMIIGELPELVVDARMRDLLTRTVQENVSSALSVLADAPEPAEVTAPPAALEFARRLAQQGVPLTAMLRAYRLGQAAFQQEMIGRLADGDSSAADIAYGATRLSAVAFGYIDSVSEQVIAAYQAERDGWLRQRNASLLSTLTTVLDGSRTDVGALERTLGYGLAGHHCAAVLWSGPDADEGRRLAGLESTAGRIAAGAGCTRPVLTVAPDASTVWAWLPTDALDVAAVEHALAASGNGSDSVFVALGEPATGLAGFRSSHRRARQAQLLALAARHTPPERVSSAARIGPLALATADLDEVAPWVQSALGPLALDDEAHARLRETVWSYLASGSSLAAAAGELHLHRNTIQYRLRRAEEARGRPLHEDRLDLEVALLACRVLGRSVLTPPGAPAPG